VGTTVYVWKRIVRHAAQELDNVQKVEVTRHLFQVSSVWAVTNDTIAEIRHLGTQRWQNLQDCVDALAPDQAANGQQCNGRWRRRRAGGETDGFRSGMNDSRLW
jgi:hypothetical protein